MFTNITLTPRDVASRGLASICELRELRKAYLGQHVTSGASFNSDKSIRVESGVGSGFAFSKEDSCCSKANSQLSFHQGK